MTDQVSEQHYWISFQLDNEHYIHTIDDVREVIPYQTPMEVPGAKGSVEGILHVRGEVITVFSGRKTLGLAEATATDQWKIIIFETSKECIGVSVDNVGEIVNISPELVSSEQGAEQSLIKGTVQHDQKLLIATDFLTFYEKHISSDI